MKYALSILMSSCIQLSAVSQEDFMSYYKPNYLPTIDAKEIIDVEFKWDMPGKAQAYLNDGLNELKEGSTLLAIGNLDESISLYPHWVSYYYRGIAYKRLHRFDEAKSDMIQAIKLNNNCAEAVIILGDIYHLTNRFTEAEIQYEKAIRINPGNVIAYYRLGNMSLRDGDTNRALKYYKKCNDIDPGFPEAYLSQALLKFSVRKKDRSAMLLFDKALEVNPLLHDGLFWRGMAFIGLGELTKALEDWDRLIQMNPNNPLLQSYRGFLHAELNNYDLAFIDLRNALMSNYEDEEKYGGNQTLLDKKIDLQAAASYLGYSGYGLKEESFHLIKKGFTLLLMSNKIEAVKCLRKSGKMEPSAPAYFLTAIAYEQSQKLDSAFHFYDLALQYDRDLLDAYKKRAIYRYELRDWKGSYQDFNEMIRLQPESLVPYRLRGYVKANLKDYYGCILDLSYVLKTDSLDYEVWKTRGFCRQQVNDTLGSLLDSKRSLKINPYNADLFETVTEGYLNLGDTALALETINEYQKVYPDYFYPHSKKAQIYINQKKYSLARESVDRCYTLLKYTINAQQLNSITIFLDGLIAFHSKNTRSAIDKFSEALKVNPNNLEARYYRFKAYQQLNDTRKAAEDLKILQKANYLDSGNFEITRN